MRVFIWPRPGWGYARFTVGYACCFLQCSARNVAIGLEKSRTLQLRLCCPQRSTVGGAGEPVVLPEEPVVLLEHQEAARQIFFMSEIAESPLW